MSYDENFSKIFITRYNTARPAVMSDVHFRHKMFSIWNVPKKPRSATLTWHGLRYTFTTNLISNGAAPKDVQELLGHTDVSTTMNVYAHSTREAKRTSARLLDKVVGG